VVNCKEPSRPDGLDEGDLCSAPRPLRLLGVARELHRRPASGISLCRRGGDPSCGGQTEQKETESGGSANDETVSSPVHTP